MQKLTYLDKESINYLLNHCEEVIDELLMKLVSEMEKKHKKHGFSPQRGSPEMTDDEEDAQYDKWEKKTHYFNTIDRYERIILRRIYEHLIKNKAYI